MFAGRVAFLLVLAVNQITFTSPIRVKRDIDDMIIIDLDHDPLFYLGNITIGTKDPNHPEQKILVIFNTADVNTVIPSVVAKDPNAGQQEPKKFTGSRPFVGFDKSISKSYVEGTQQEATERFKGRKYTGVKASDTIKIGRSKELQALTGDLQWTQSFLLATTPSEDKAVLAMFGLGLDPRLKMQDSTASFSAVEALFDAATAQNLKIKQQFGFYLRPVTMTTSRVVIGGYDDRFVLNGEFTTVKVIKTGTTYSGWKFELEKFSVQGEDVLTRTGAIPHSAWPYIGLPSEALKTVNMKLFGKEDPGFNLLFHCDAAWKEHANKTIEFTINGKIFVLTTKDFIAQTHKNYNDESYKEMYGDNWDQSECTYAIGESENGMVLLGLPFMRKYYTRFDYKEKEIAFGLTIDLV